MSFGRLERSKADKPMSDINVTPLVDVMLVLLVIFIIAAPFMASRLSLELPKAEVPAAAPAAPEASVSIALDAQGQLHWNDEPLAEDALKELATTLKKRCGTGGALKDGIIEIQGDHVELLLAELIKHGFKAKKSGG